MHVIDVNLYSEGTTVIDRWLVALSLGSGQTRNMALDRYDYLKNVVDIMWYLCSNCIDVKNSSMSCNNLVFNRAQ